MSIQFCIKVFYCFVSLKKKRSQCHSTSFFFHYIYFSSVMYNSLWPIFTYLALYWSGLCVLRFPNLVHKLFIKPKMSKTTSWSRRCSTRNLEIKTTCKNDLYFKINSTRRSTIFTCSSPVFSWNMKSKNLSLYLIAYNVWKGKIQIIMDLNLTLKKFQNKYFWNNGHVILNDYGPWNLFNHN